MKNVIWQSRQDGWWSMAKRRWSTFGFNTLNPWTPFFVLSGRRSSTSEGGPEPSWRKMVSLFRPQGVGKNWCSCIWWGLLDSSNAAQRYKKALKVNRIWTFVLHLRIFIANVLSHFESVFQFWYRNIAWFVYTQCLQQKYICYIKLVEWSSGTFNERS